MRKVLYISIEKTKHKRSCPGEVTKSVLLVA